MSDVLDYPAGARSSSIFAYPAEMAIRGGAPSLLGNSDTPRWLLDPVTPEILSFNLTIPAGWTTADPYVWWAPTDATAGVYRSIFYYASGDNVPYLTPGSPFASLTLWGVDGTTPGVANQIVRTKAKLTPLNVGAGGPARFSIGREGNHANDTYAADVALLAVEIVKVS